MGNESYVARKEEEQDTFGNSMFNGQPNIAKPLIEHSDTNKYTVDTNQARWKILTETQWNINLMLCQDIEGKTVCKMILKLIDGIEFEQGALDDHNRKQYIETATRPKQSNGFLGFGKRNPTSQPVQNSTAED